MNKAAPGKADPQGRLCVYHIGDFTVERGASASP